MSSHFNTPISQSNTNWHSSVVSACQLSRVDTPLCSTHKILNSFFDGGLPLGSVCEWGSPWGSGGRELALTFLKSKLASDNYWSLWVQAQEGSQFYAPALQSRGVDLDYLRLAYTKTPIKDLKAVFTDSFFKFVILDSCVLSKDDCAFLKRQAKALNQTILLIRPYFLSERNGNVWAKIRLNCWQNMFDSKYYLKVVKGLSPRSLSIDNLGPTSISL